MVPRVRRKGSEGSREEILDLFRELSAEHFDAEALKLSLLGALVQKGCSIARPIVDGGDDAQRAAAREDLDWWTAAARSALEIWSPV